MKYRITTNGQRYRIEYLLESVWRPILTSTYEDIDEAKEEIARLRKGATWVEVEE